MKIYWIEFNGVRKYFHVKDGCLIDKDGYTDIIEQDLIKWLNTAEVLGFKTGIL